MRNLSARTRTSLRRATSVGLESLESRRLLAAITWANASGHANWNDTAAWVGGVVPGASDTAVFPSAATIVQPVLNANLSVGGVTLNNSGADYSISGTSFTLTVGSSGIALSSPTSTTASTSTISAKLALSASSTYSAANNTGVNTLNVTGTINLGTFVAATSGTGNISFTGIVSGSGSIASNGTGSTLLNKANTFTGGVTINSGTVLAQSSSATLGTGAVLLGSTSGSANATLGTTVGFTNPITVRSGNTGTMLIEGQSTSTTMTLSGALTLQKAVTIQKSAASAASTLGVTGGTSGTGNITLRNDGTGGNVVLGGASVNVAGSISNTGAGAGGVQITGVIGSSVTGLTQNSSTSALDVRSNNPAFTGAITIDAGTLGVTPTATGYTTQLGTGTIQLGATSGSAAAVMSLNNATHGGDVSNPLTVRSGGTGERSIRYNSTSGSGVYRGFITLNTALTLRKSTGGGGFGVSGGLSGTGNLTLDHQGTGAFNITTNSINTTGTLSSVGAGAGTITISGGIGNGVTTITQSGTAPLAITTTALSRTANLSLVNSGAGAVTVSSAIAAGSAGTKTITHTGSGTGALTISGTISNGSGTVAITQNSATSALLINSTSNSYTGATTVSAGTIGGTGKLNGAVTVASGATLAPGAVGATAIQTTGALTLNAGSNLAAQVNTSTAGSGYDQASVVGTVSLQGANLLLSGTRTSTLGQTIQIIANDGTDAVVGWFLGLTEGAVASSNGVAYRISYKGGTGNDVVLTDLGPVSALTDDSPYSVAPAHSSINIVVNGTTGATRFDTWAPLIDQNDIQWVRTFVNGAATSTQGVYSWTKWDHTLDVAEANNVRISGGFSGTPSFINTTGGFPVGATQLAQWQQYVTDVVTHTAGRVKHWEVWNEPPNFTNGLGTWTEYGALVAATYDAIKAVDPTAQVGMAAVSTYTTWLKQAILNGAAGKYDYVTLHPYEIGDTIHHGHEAAFMSIVPTVRKMLADVDPAKVNVPIWWTEIGQPITSSQNAVSQANQLVKFYTMGLAQGAERISWFEPLDGDSGAFGLFNNSYVIRESGQAYSRLIDSFGNNPNYVGWVQLDGTNYGFVFEGASGHVMVTWAPPGTSDSVTFASSVTLTNPITGATASGTTHTLTNDPVLVTNLPASLITLAATNKTLPFPWGGDYSAATSVNVSYVGAVSESGLHHLDDNTITLMPAYGQTVAYAGGSLFQQAETATLSGASALSTNANYTGTGYADFTTPSGGYVQYSATSSGAASRTFRIRYANGDASARAVSLSVNGTVVNGALSFPSTGNWTTWRTLDITVSLISGANTIRFTTTGSDGPNLDAVLSPSAAQSYTVDPNFLSYDHTPITITAEVRRDEANNGAGFNMWYESTTGFKTTGSWNNVSTNASWQTMSWTINDAEFVARWGKHFWFNSDSGSNSRYYIRNVTVTKNGMLMRAAPLADASESSPTPSAGSKPSATKTNPFSAQSLRSVVLDTSDDEEWIGSWLQTSNAVL